MKSTSYAFKIAFKAKKFDTSKLLKQDKFLNTVAKCFNENIILVKLVVSRGQFIWIFFVSLPFDTKLKGD